LTTAKFFSPTGRPISHQGVEPHIAVQVTAKPAVSEVSLNTDPAAGPTQDASLESALRVARQQVARR
jgi:carboxyl-terminal processing protease